MTDNVLAWSLYICRASFLMFTFTDVSILQGSVVTHLRFGGIINIYFTADLLELLTYIHTFNGLFFHDNLG